MRPTILHALAALLIGAAPRAGQAQLPEADAALQRCIAAAGTGDERATRAAAEAAEAHFRAARAARPGDAEPLAGLARVISQCRIRFANAFSAGRLVGESNRLLGEALELDPRHWNARFTLAMNHYHTPGFLGRADDAMREFETLLRQQGDRRDDPVLALPFAFLGDLYLRAGRKAEAAALWRRGAALFPADAALRERLARLGPEEPAAAAYELEAVTVRARRLPPGVVQGGVSVDRLEVVTAPGGTADLLQAVRMQGGVTQATEGSDLFVRGGEPAEAPVFLDGGRILYPGTFETLDGGLFGVLSPDVFREATFFSGGFSVRYGNALSGVLDVRSEGRPTEAAASVGVNLAGAHAGGSLPLGSRAGVWGAAKATDASVLTWMQGGADDFPVSPRALEGTFGAVAHPRPEVEVKLAAVAQGDGATRSVESHGHRGAFRSRGGTRLAVLSARAARADGAVALASLSAARRTSAFRFGALDRRAVDRTLSASLSAGVPVGRSATVRAGAEAAGYEAEAEGWMPRTARVGPDAPRDWSDTRRETHHLGAFVEVESSPRPRLSLVAGLRTDRLPGETGVTTDPRLSAAWKTPDWTLRLGGGIFRQGRWRVGYDVPDATAPGGLPRRARHLSAGVEREGGSGLKVEAYLKRYDRYVPDGPGPQVEAGEVLGVDARSRWSRGERLSGWAVYSWMRGRVRLEDGPTVPSRVDVTHGFTGVARLAIGSAWELGTTARLATGRPYTPAAAASPDPVPGEVHGGRLPTYARLDARLTHLRTVGGRGVVAYLEGLNVLGRSNVMAYTRDASDGRRLAVESFFARPVAMLGMEVRLR